MNTETYYKLRYIYLFAIVNCLIMTYIFKVDVSIDTPTYIDAWTMLQNGQIDKFRTPVYPVFLGVMNIICGDNYLWYVVAVQHVVFLVSIRYLYVLMINTISNQKIVFILILFYALYPCVATYNCCIATETFAVSCLIFLLYSIWGLYINRLYRYGLYSFIWLFLLVFLRPAVIYLLPITFLCWSILAIKEIKFFNVSVLLGIAGSVVVSILLIAYMFMFKNTYGIFTPSGISLNNKYSIAKAAAVIDYDSIENDEIFSCLVNENNINAIGKEAENIINTVGMKGFSDLVDNSIRQNKEKYVLRLFQNIRNASDDNLFEPSYRIGYIGFISDIMGIKINILYFLFLLYTFILIRWMRCHKEFAFFSCLLFMIGVSNYILIVIASPGEYGRLSLPAIPAYLIMIGRMLDSIQIKGINKICFN